MARLRYINAEQPQSNVVMEAPYLYQPVQSEQRMPAPLTNALLPANPTRPEMPVTPSTTPPATVRRTIPTESRALATELRPWQMGQIIPEAGGVTKAAAGAMQALTINDEEFARILKQADPTIIVDRDRDSGEYYVYSPKTKKSFVINKSGISLNDATNLATTLAVSLPAGRAATLAGRAVAEAGIQTAIESGQAGMGADFNIEEPMLSGAFSAGTDLFTLARKSRQVARGVNSVEQEGIRQGISPEIAPVLSSVTRVAASNRTPLQQAAELSKIVDADPNVVAAANRLNLSEVLPARVYSRNPQYVQFEQALAYVPATSLASSEKAALLATAGKADEFITEFGGTRSISDLSEGIVNNINGTLNDLRGQSDLLYEKIGSSVPQRTRVEATGVRSYLINKARDLGGIDNLNSLEKEILRKISGNGRRPTYAYLDSLRRKVGEQYAVSLKGNQFGDAATYELSSLYNILGDAQGNAIEQIAGNQVKETWGVAKNLVAQRKTLEKSATDLLGKEFSRPVVPQVRSSINALIKNGDIYGFNKLLEGIPEQYRQAAVVSSLDTLFTSGARNETQLNKGGFASAWEKLSRQPKAKEALLKYMPENAGQFLDDLALVSKQYSTAISSTNRTGIVNAMEKFGADQGFVSRVLPMIPFGKKIDEAISLATPDVLKTASNLMQNPDFKRIIINGAKGEPADKIEKSLMDSPAFKVWFEELPANYKSRILSVGLTDYFLGD